ncbi:hypothetical protein ES703_62701 [subsurface metagenome]
MYVAFATTNMSLKKGMGTQVSRFLEQLENREKKTQIM